MTPSENNVATNERHSRNERRQNISYAMVETIDSADTNIEWAILLADEFEVRVIQHNDEWNEDYLNNLSFSIITLSN